MALNLRSVQKLILIVLLRVSALFYDVSLFFNDDPILLQNVFQRTLLGFDPYCHRLTIRFMSGVSDNHASIVLLVFFEAS